MSDYDYMDERLTTPGPFAAAQNESLTLSSGTRFGRYEILSPLGAGGMGEVYRARDTRLGLDLAIKILSSKLWPGKQDFERFEREACSASALNHPNIVKILDFGLAKLVNRDSDQLPGAAALATSQTLPGAVLGTIEYMSPEQANGLPLDFRSDQFSFGSVLYEMVTGKRSFQRRSKAETLAAILRDDPEPVVSLNPQAPAPLCWVIERCLAKDPKQRYTSTRDLVRDLATIRDRLSEAPSRHSPPRSSNLPAQRTVLIGRDQEVEAVKELLLRQDVHVITLTGPGGIGKTRLGLQVAEEVAQSFPSGVFFVPLAAVSDTALVPSIIAQALGMRETGRQVTIESLKEYLQDLRTNLLLLFDNFEHLLAAARAAAELLTITPKLKILVTSRAPLHIYGEHEVPVPSLAVPDLRSTISLQALSKNPSIALFLARAAAVKPNFQLT